MANQLYLPFLNPLNFVDKDQVQDARYATRQIDDYQIEDRRLPFQQAVRFNQVWVADDIIKIQLESNYDPIQVTMYDWEDQPVVSQTLLYKLKNKYDPLMRIYEALIPLTDIPPGEYYIEIYGGSPVQKTLQSNRFEIVESVEDTVLLEYDNSSFYGGVMFETGINLSMRVPGYLTSFAPASKDVLYEDQALNQTVLSSKPFRTFKLECGGSEGIPPEMGDKLNWILGCDNVSCDGKLITKADGAKWEVKDQEGYPMYGYSIDVRETLRRDSKVFLSTGDSAKKLLLIHDVESKGFGGNSVVPIVDLE